MRFLIGFTFVACLVHLHEASPHRYRRQTATNPVICQDQDVCSTTPDICSSGDPDIMKTLCPVTCGGCVCEDDASTGGNCSSLVPTICTEDLGPTLCPKSCGFCKVPAAATTVGSTCVDQVIGISCADLPSPCDDELGKEACKKFCNLCPEDLTTAAPNTTATPVQTTVQTSACDNSPCLNGGTCQETSGGSYTCACPSTHTGVICHIAAAATTQPPTTLPPATQPPTTQPPTTQPPTTQPPTTQPPTTLPPTTQPPTTLPPTTLPPTTTPTPTLSNGCPVVQTTKSSMGCVPAEIVFMIEYSKADHQWSGVGHEGEYIKALVDKWQLDDSHIRVGVIVYHDSVRESIHLGDYSNTQNLKDKISSLTRYLRPSGDADLGRAIDYARQSAFTGARPGVERILIPIIHQTQSPEKERIVPAADRLKADCIALLGIAVRGSHLDPGVVQSAVSSPTYDYYQYYNSYIVMEDAAKNYFTPDCSNI